jgi:proteasome accessory factor C
VSRPGAEERLRRILALVPWVASADGPLVTEVCQRFGYASEAELQADVDLLFLCGVHPFSPDALIEVDMDGGRIWIRYAGPYFRRPLRLTPAEALSLVASSAALLGDDASAPLARGLAKLAAALGIDPEEAVDVELGPAPPATLATLRSAATARRQVEIEYYGYGRDEHTTRVIEPALVYSAAGQWYVAGYCHLAGDRRLFRVDRIEAATMLDAGFAETPVAAPPPVYAPAASDPVVVLELSPAAAWVVGLYPLEQVTDLGDGRSRVALRVSGRAWLERLLLRLGPDAILVEGDATVKDEAVARVLARYGAVRSAAGQPLPSTGNG